MEEREYNLIDEQWIRVIDTTCKISQVSIREFFEKAHEYTNFSGEMRTQDIAIMRMLLAIMNTAFSRYDENGNPRRIRDEDDGIELWGMLWDAGIFPMAPLDSYLKEHYDDFWLFHPETPFYQIKEAGLGTSYDISKLNGEIFNSNNKPRLFQKVSSKQKQMSYDMAARWLIHLVAFDDCSAKKPSPKQTWLGQLGMIILEGNNLFETMLLNFICDKYSLIQDQIPTWELSDDERKEFLPKEINGKKEARELSTPKNRSALYTVLSRDILLRKEEGYVTGYNLMAGGYYSNRDISMEPMTLWHQKEEKNIVEVAPIRHDMAKQMWREFPQLFDYGHEKDKRCIPGVIKWISDMESENILSEDYIVKVRAATVRYDSAMMSAVTDIYADSLTCSAALLSNMKRNFRKRISDAVRYIEEIAQKIGFLAQDLSLASGGSKESGQPRKAYNEACAQYYINIDRDFRQWIYDVSKADISKDPEGNELYMAWCSQAEIIALRLGNDMAKNAGVNAYVGREVNSSNKKSDKTELYSSPKALKHFKMNIKTKERRH